MTRTRFGMLTLSAVVLGLSVLGAANVRLKPDTTDPPGSVRLQPDQTRSVSSLTGVARAMDGRLMGGVAVSARAIASSITTSVFTDEHGQYFFPPLENGRYALWAQAAGYETARAEV